MCTKSLYIYRDIRVCVYMYKYVLGCYCYKETSGKFITKHLPKYRRQVRSPPNRRWWRREFPAFTNYGMLIWKICVCQFGSFPQFSGWKWKMFETTTYIVYTWNPFVLYFLGIKTRVIWTPGEHIYSIQNASWKWDIPHINWCRISIRSW